MVQKILPLLKDKNYKDATVLVRKADYMAGNQDLRYGSIKLYCIYCHLLILLFNPKSIAEARGKMCVLYGAFQDISIACQRLQE